MIAHTCPRCKGDKNKAKDCFPCNATGIVWESTAQDLVLSHVVPVAHPIGWTGEKKRAVKKDV